ncbi:hypothetical protein TgHK011_007363 [Trichoderma gracile]|nr:hypothetical protein TgHK011_007363 [Trichoderma gracile]
MTEERTKAGGAVFVQAVPLEGTLYAQVPDAAQWPSRLRSSSKRERRRSMALAGANGDAGRGSGICVGLVASGADTSSRSRSRARARAPTSTRQSGAHHQLRAASQAAKRQHQRYRRRPSRTTTSQGKARQDKCRQAIRSRFSPKASRIAMGATRLDGEFHAHGPRPHYHLLHLL